MTSNEQLHDEITHLVQRASGQPLPAINLGAPADPEKIARQLQHAQFLADVSVVPPQQRLGAVKRLVMRAARLFTVRQAAFNEQTVETLSVLNHQIATNAASAEQKLSTLSAALVHVEVRSDEVIDAAVRDTRSMVDSIVGELGVLREKLVELSAASNTIQRLADAAQSSASLDRRYSDFEDRFRGSEASIEGLLLPYVDDIYPLKGSGGAVLDLGCGRGEWLRLLATHGIPAHGVDMNKDAVAACVADGLDVVFDDCIDHLESLPEGSLLAVTAFHLIEHLPVALHGPLFEAAYRALHPGGLLIVETPNPTNLVVGAAAFYRDPSHLRPVHPDYLDFLAADCGFERNEIRYLHPRPEYEGLEVADDDAVGREIAWAMFGPQDVALVGHRSERRPADR